MRSRIHGCVLAAVVMIAAAATFAQADLVAQLGELASLTAKVADPETRVRVSAFHRVWSIAMHSDNSEVKLRALELIREPIGSVSDHIRMPAVYAVSEIANSTADQQVKRRALAILQEPMNAAQLPIRNAAIDATNAIVRNGLSRDLTPDALRLLAEPVRSGNNGVRIPAIHAILRAVDGCKNEKAYNDAIDLLTAPLDSMAMIGGMEVRLMAVVAVERIGVQASEVGTKSKAMGLLHAYSSKSHWESEARARAMEAAAEIQNSLKR